MTNIHLIRATTNYSETLKDPFNKAIPLIRQAFYDPLVTRLTGIHCIINNKADEFSPRMKSLNWTATFRQRLLWVLLCLNKYGYHCADFLIENVNESVIRAKSCQNTICNWSGMLNLHVPKKWVLGEKLISEGIRFS